MHILALWMVGVIPWSGCYFECERYSNVAYTKLQSKLKS